jgi:hypothetical protein
MLQCSIDGQIMLKPPLHVNKYFASHYNVN